MKLRWTERAAGDLEAIQEYISQDSTAAAKRVVRRIIERARQIPPFPAAGRVVPEYDAREIREVIQGPYRILYVADDEAIHVLTVRHGTKPLPDEAPAIDADASSG